MSYQKDVLDRTIAVLLVAEYKEISERFKIRIMHYRQRAIMTGKVLIVDDEPDIRESIGYLIRREGFLPYFANSAKQAIINLKKQKFDLVLMDIFMPKVSGRECVEIIRKTPGIKDQKIAFLSVAQLSEQGKNELEKLSPADYITKPINIDDFSKRLRNLVKNK